jgi:hypothetical protein
LSQAGLIEGGFITATDAAVTAATQDALRLYLPQSPLKASLLHVFYFSGKNYIFLGAIESVAGGTLMTSSLDALTPANADKIDGKIDDGLPQTGRVRAGSWSVATSFLDTGSGCFDNAIPPDYSVWSEAVANTPICRLRIDLQ